MKASLLCRILGQVIHIKMRLCKMPGTENQVHLVVTTVDSWELSWWHYK